ncbi:MAG: GAF domain-containing protein [candidate division NC10 bacterium]|nr:GAF domain-containing protein [candidate division NC10 bacterium]
MRQARSSDLPARLAAILASDEVPADPGERFRPFLRVLAEGLSLPGAALFEAAGDGFALLAEYGLPAGWVEGAAALSAQDPVAAAALGHPGVAILPGKPGWPRLPLMGHAAAVELTVGAGLRRTLGLLVAFAEGPEAFQEPVADLLRVAASLLAGAMASEERFREATARAERLRDLARVARRLVALLDAEGLPQVVAEEAARLLRAEAAVFRILEGDQLRLVAQAGGGAGSPVWRDLLRVGESLSGAVAAEGKAITIADLTGETRMLPAHREAAQAQGYRAYLGLPLHRRGQLVGVLSLYGKKVGAFTPEDVELGTGLVEQVTLALEKAELLRRERQERDRLRTLHALSRSVEGSLDLPEIFRQVVAAAAGLLGVPHAILWSPETAGGTLRQQAEHLAAGETVGPLRRAAGLALAGAAVESGEPVRLTALAGDPRVGAGFAEDPDGQLAFAAVPLRLNERMLGAVGVFSAARPGRAVPAPLDDEGMDLLTFLADHAAIAIANARLYQEARRRAERLTAMADVARTLTSSLEERAVFERIVRAAADLLEGDMARLWVYEESRGLLRVAAGVGAPDFPLPPRDTFAPGEGLVGTVFAERAPRVVIDPEREPLYAQQTWAAAAGIRAAAAVPVRMGERALGVLSVVFRKPPHLGAEELSLLTSFANQAAVAMENARLYQDLKAYSASLEEKVRERTAALEAANVKLTEANRLKSAFLANVSHELRTPLNAIIGFSEVLEDGAFGPLNERQRLYVRNILESGQHLLGLITDILDLSKIEAGKMDLRLGRFSVAKALGEALEVVRGQAMRKAITLTLEAGDDLPVLTADPGKFRQVCLNLLSNAVKFTPDGGRVAVTARAATLDGPQGAVAGVEVTVADTGIGIEAADQERIFREFEQVDGSYARKYPGTGLGLALTRKLVEMHGGTIRVESAGPGRGATFRVRLPLRPPVLEGEILLVDDDADLLQGLTETFTRLGYGVRAARDGEEALAAVAAVPPDCLVLDLHLPRVNGLQVLRALRERPATREIPVVALTGWGEQEGREALRLGAQEFLTKPVSPSVLAATVDRLMQRVARERGR